MDDQLNLTLPQRKDASRGASKTVVFLLCVLLLLGVANLSILLYRSRQIELALKENNGLSSEGLKELALRLEKQGIRTSAVQTWKEYLTQADAEPQEQAKIWYRIGKILQDDGRSEQALGAFYRSETLAKIPDLEPEINLRIQESLEGLGKFAALHHELAGRVNIKSEDDKGTGEPILAEIGNHKITASELDSRIEQMIENQLASLAPFLSDDEKKSRKDSLLKHFSSTSERERMLNQLVVEEMLYRKAAEDRLKEEDAAVRMMIQQAERSLLAQQVLAKELAENIKITEGDLGTFYEAHKQDYMDPEQVKISHILVKDQETVDLVFAKLKQGLAFKDLVKEFSLDRTTMDNDGEIQAWIRRGGSVPGIGSSEDIDRIIFSTEEGMVADEAIPSDAGFHIVKVREKKKNRQQSFNEARQAVYRSLRSQKEGEVQQNLLEQLKERYNVVIHMSSFQEDSGPTNTQP